MRSGRLSSALADLTPSFAKLSPTNNDGFILFRKDVGNRPFHRTGPGGGENQHLIFRLEEILQPLPDLSEDSFELGFPVVHDGFRHPEQHLGREHGRSGGEQILLFHIRFLSCGENQIILFDIPPYVNTHPYFAAIQKPDFLVFQQTRLRSEILSVFQVLEFLSCMTGGPTPSPHCISRHPLAEDGLMGRGVDFWTIIL